MTEEERFEDFLAGEVYAVVGASTKRHKYGNKVLRCYLQNGRTAWPVHPYEPEIEGQATVTSLANLPTPVHGISIITPPQISLKIIEEAALLGIHRIWLQPGAEDEQVLRRAEELGLDLIASGPCLLVILGYREWS